MRTEIFQLDSFTTQRFKGNPAAVLALAEFPAPTLMQDIAAENNQSETAFIVRAGDAYRIRWFSPTTEVPLCGHATLASAAVVMERIEPGRSEVVFHSASGPLTVRRTGGGYLMDFPARFSAAAAPPDGLSEMLGARPVEVVADEFNYLVRLESAEVVRALNPDPNAIAGLDRGGLIVTAGGDGVYDFTSRYFAPAKGIPEDPVTGGAHCALAPYWADRLGKQEFRAYQASRRGGELVCRLRGSRVELEGACVFYSHGWIEI
jgi:predicted PhzF superfamily epimerase YddE/YHI9